MATANQLVMQLVMDSNEFIRQIDESIDAIEKFSGSLSSDLTASAAQASEQLNRISEQSSMVGWAAGAAAAAMSCLGVAARTLGGAVPGVNGLASALGLVAGAAFEVSGSTRGIAREIQQLDRQQSFMESVATGIRRISLAAGVTSLGLRGVSLAMQQFGASEERINTLNQWATNLNRIAFAATASGLALRAGMATYNAFSNTLTTIQNLAASAGNGVAQAVMRMAQAPIGLVNSAWQSLAATMTRVQSLASSGLGLVGSGLHGLAVTGGNLASSLLSAVTTLASGAAIAGPVGLLAAGGGLLAGHLLGQRQQSEGTTIGSGSDGAAGQMLGRLQDVGQWLSEISSTAWGSVVPGVEAIGQRGVKWFNAFLEAIHPLTDAIQNTWLPAFVGAMDSAGASFENLMNFIENSWGEWISSSITAIADFVGNFDIHLQIATQKALIFGANLLTTVEGLYNNFGSWMDWFGENWHDVLTTAFDFAATVFINLGQNIRNIFTEIWEWVSSGFTKELSIDWTPLTEGFRSTIREWPEFAQQQMLTTTDELERLQNQLDERRFAAGNRPNPIGQAFARGGATEKEEDESGKKRPVRSDSPFGPAAMWGSQEAASSILRGMSHSFGDPKETPNAIGQQTEALSGLLGQIRDLLRQNGDHEFAVIDFA